jgi:hypothetical protein
MSQSAKPELVIYQSNGFSLFCLILVALCSAALLFGWLDRIIPYPVTPNSSNTINWTIEYGVCFLTILACELFSLLCLIVKLLGIPQLLIDLDGITNRFAGKRIRWADIDCVWAGSMDASKIGARLDIIGRWQHLPVWPLKGQPKFGKPSEICAVNFIQLSLDSSLVIKTIAAYLADQPGTTSARINLQKRELFEWHRAEIEQN